MKKTFVTFLSVIFLLSQTGIAEASYSLKVTLKVDLFGTVYPADTSSEFREAYYLLGSPEALAAQKKYATFAKTKLAASKALNDCKTWPEYNAKIKVTEIDSYNSKNKLL